MKPLKDFVHNDVYIGQYYESDRYYVFFGNRHCHSLLLQELFPEFQWSYIKQVHGKTVTERPPINRETEADGQYTTQSNLALCIRTADCMPVFWWGEHTIAALHCGWRGIQKNIIGQSIKETNISPTEAFIGPFISKDTFEVGKDVGMDLNEPYKRKGGKEKVLYTHHDPNKFYVDLLPLVWSQLHLPQNQICQSNHRTMESKTYYSYRRDPDNQGRNISFIVKK